MRRKGRKEFCGTDLSNIYCRRPRLAPLRRKWVFVWFWTHNFVCVSLAFRVFSIGINFHKALGIVLLSTHPKWTLTRQSWITYRTIAGASLTPIYVTSTYAYTNIEREAIPLNQSFHSHVHRCSLSQHVLCVHLSCYCRERGTYSLAYHHLSTHSHINAK